MKISLLQTDIRWKDPRANRRRAEELISDLPAADLIVLPEMFTTGFCTDPTETAEPADSETLAWMRSVAAARNAAVGGSVATEADGRYYNRFYFVKPDGSYATYDKRHLFSFAGEDKRYTAGTERVVVEHCGFRILLQVCYDLRFPVFARNRGDYDMILYVAQLADGAYFGVECTVEGPVPSRTNAMLRESTARVTIRPWSMTVRVR